MSDLEKSFLDDILEGSESSPVEPSSREEDKPEDKVDEKERKGLIKAAQEERERAKRAIAENEELKKRLDEVEAKMRPLEPLLRPQPEPAEESLATQDDWKNLIKKTAEESSRKVMDDLRTSSMKKAVKRFVELHPEYSKQENRSRLESVLKTAERLGFDDVYDIETVVERLKDGHMVENRKEIEARERRRADLYEDAQSQVADLASSSSMSSSARASDSETDDEDVGSNVSDRRAYRVYRERGGTMSLSDFIKKDQAASLSSLKI